MVLLNFAHPLTAEHLAQVRALTGRPVARVVDAPVQADPGRPLTEQIAEIADRAGLTAEEWQTLPLVVNPPGYAPAAVALLAELHGRMGYFPAVLWMRPAPGSTPRQFQVGEVLNLQAVRDAARSQR